MNPLPVLDRVVLGYSPVHDLHRKLCGVRLAVHALEPAWPGSDRSVAAAMAAALWPQLQTFRQQAPERHPRLPPVWLSVTNEALLDALLAVAQEQPLPILMEVPAFLAATRGERLQALAGIGQPVCLSAQVTAPAPAAMPGGLSWMSCAAAELPDGMRLQRPHGMSWLVEGARIEAEFAAAIAMGAAAVAGWPIDDEWQAASPAQIPPELRGVLELMNRVEREEPLARLEAVLTADPSLAYRLLRYLNTSAFGLRVEVSSFKHGLQMLGYRKLQRWLGMLLLTGCQDPQARVLMGVAARRGLILDELANGFGDDAMRGEMILCGAFSLLDRMLRVPLAELIRSVPMPQRVQDSLLEHGPYTAHLALLKAVEGGLPLDVRDHAQRALVGVGELNRAVLKGLSQAWELD